MSELKNYEFWFITGSQNLYGEDTLRQVKNHSEAIVKGLNDSQFVPYKVIYKSVVTSSDKFHK